MQPGAEGLRYAKRGLSRRSQLLGKRGDVRDGRHARRRCHEMMGGLAVQAALRRKLERQFGKLRR